MVGPITEDERRFATQRLVVGFVGFVGVSSALTAFYLGATPFETGLVAGTGLLAGVALLVAIGAWP